MDDPHRDAMASAAEVVLREWFESRKPWKLIGDALERAMDRFLDDHQEQIIEAIAQAVAQHHAPPASPPEPSEQRPRRFNERDDEDEEWEGPIDAEGLPPFPDKLDF